MPSGNDTVGDLKREAYLRRREFRQQAVNYKGGKCEICGYIGFPSSFDFHHLNTATKDFNISDRLASLEVMIPELDKCSLLCCRCHREVHEGLHPQYLISFEDAYPDVGPPPPNDLSYEEEVDVEAALEQARVSLEVAPMVRARRNRSSSRLTVRQ